MISFAIELAPQNQDTLTLAFADSALLLQAGQPIEQRALSFIEAARDIGFFLRTRTVVMAAGISNESFHGSLAGPGLASIL